MRIASFLSALLVFSALYMVVFERDVIRAVSQGAPISQLLPSVSWTVEPATQSGDVENTDESTAEPSGSKDDDRVAVKVVAVRSQGQEIDNAVILRGQTEATRKVDVRAETTGQVVSEPLRKGARVERGDVLCQLDPGTREIALSDALARAAEAEARVPETRARLQEAQSRLDEAKINYNAAKKLAEDGFATETRVASTEAAVKAAQAGVASAQARFKSTQSGIQSAQAAVAAAQKEIERLTLRAPFAGLIEADTAELGSLLQPGGLCSTIIQLDPIKVVGFVAESDMPRVKVGSMAAVSLLAGQNTIGSVSFLSRSADKQTRTFQVDIDISNKDGVIAEGQTADIMIQTEGTLAHLIPQSALTLNDNGDLGVRIITDQSKALFVPIGLLRDTEKGVWLAGLPKSASVIIRGQEYVVNGVLVDAIYEELTQ
ncbi:MAG: efflux RND transporter periplasmic adaptor subunit [Paracoccaceae bacterium]